MTHTSLHKRKAQRAGRVRAKIFGTASRPRLSIFRSNYYIYAQLIDDEKGHTLLSASTREGKTPSKKQDVSRALGERIGKSAKEKGIKEAVFDLISLSVYLVDRFLKKQRFLGEASMLL